MSPTGWSIAPKPERSTALLSAQTEPWTGRPPNAFAGSGAALPTKPQKPESRWAPARRQRQDAGCSCAGAEDRRTAYGPAPRRRAGWRSRSERARTRRQSRPANRASNWAWSRCIVPSRTAGVAASRRTVTLSRTTSRRAPAGPGSRGLRSPDRCEFARIPERSASRPLARRSRVALGALHGARRRAGCSRPTDALKIRRWVHRMAGTRHPEEVGLVPTIDIGPFTAGEARARAGVVGAVRAACEDIGFFVMTGHGFPEELATRIYDASRAFFDLPAAEKSAVGETGPVLGGLMHFAFGEEALAATLGKAAIGDLKETLDYGPGFFGDRWPSNPPDLEASWRAYYEAMSGLAATVRRIFAAALGLDPDYFEDRFQGHLSSLRVIDYPESLAPPAPGQLRAGAHSDYGVLT
ncbi:MAG: isopenicillin N synthase family oxygenase, partial [Rhodospirillaceae bacterium]|nr:isopenicillin N synthase family oxygenase [Rhodospirillaceae bacterium]